MTEDEIRERIKEIRSSRKVSKAPAKRAITKDTKDKQVSRGQDLQSIVAGMTKAEKDELVTKMKEELGQ